jgi:phage tail-like protein
MTAPTPMAPLDPLPKYRFLVTLDPGDAYLPPAQAQLLPMVANGAFQEVTGLGASLDVLAYPEGGRNDSVRQLPVRHSWNHIVLKRGVVRDPGLWSWYVAGLADSLGARRDGAIVLLGPDGTPAMSWAFRAGLAAKWSGPDLHAEQNAIAVESLEIAHEGLTRVSPADSGSALSGLR